MTPEQIEKYLDRHPDDWDFRLCAADAIEEAGDELRAAFLRWSGKEKNCPVPDRPSKQWLWWDWNETHPNWPPHGRLPAPMKYMDLAYFWRTREHHWYPNDSRLEAEWALAVYLREKGLI